MKLDLIKLGKLGYIKNNGEEYIKHDNNDHVRKVVNLEHNTNVYKTRFVRINRYQVNCAEDINYIISLYKSLKEDVKNCTIQESVNHDLLTNEEKNYLNVMLAQCKNNVLYITIVKKLDKRMLRVRYNIGSYYSYIPLDKGFEKLKENQNYTLKELGI